MKKINFGEIVTLKDQRCVYLSVKEGLNIIRIKVFSWSLRLNHCCYTPDGGTWLSSPNAGRKAHYDFKQNDDIEITVDIRESFNKLDRIEIVNPTFFHKSVFIVYSID